MATFTPDELRIYPTNSKIELSRLGASTSFRNERRNTTGAIAQTAQTFTTSSVHPGQEIFVNLTIGMPVTKTPEAP